MISAEVEDGETTVALGDGLAVAYVDAAWLTGSGGPLRGLAVADEGSLRWYDGSGGWEELDARPEPELAGVGMLEGLASRAALLVADAAGPVEVTGDGAVAQVVAARLGVEPGRQHDGPAAIVETTGRPEAIVDALARVADLGTVVLAGPPPAEGLEHDLYGDVHLRGLRLVGVGRPDPAAFANGASTGDAVDEPHRVVSGERLAAGTACAWLRIDAAA